MKILENRNILLGVCGGISAYKVPEIVRELQTASANVSIVFTENGEKFVSKYTLDILTEGKIYTDMFKEGITHINLAKKNDVIAIIPATYNVIGKIASGVANDLLTTVISAFKKPVIFFPSMNDAMYENPVLVKNISYLKSIGYEFVEPAFGKLICGEEGKGRLPDTKTIIFNIAKMFSDRLYKGKKIVVTAGGTEEHIDPVRVITNSSSGKMGLEIAKAFTLMGADVTLLIGRCNFDIPLYINHKRFKTSKDLLKILKQEIQDADILFMAAAVSDFIPVYSNIKIKSGKEETLILKPSVDILQEISKSKNKTIIVGFCVEKDEDLISEGKRKLLEKGCDLLIANTIDTIGGERTKGYIIYRNRDEFFEYDKEEFAWYLTKVMRQFLT